MFMLTNPVYRAIVTYSSTATGEIKVRIPALTGLSDVVPISKVGRTAYNGIWPVPSIGSQIVVTADDDRLNNVFWVQVSPDAPTSLAPIQAQVDAQQIQVDAQQIQVDAQQDQIDYIDGLIASQQTQLTELASYIDAIILGVFN
jgi:phage baseplate assembly protein gpV